MTWPTYAAIYVVVFVVSGNAGPYHHVPYWKDREVFKKERTKDFV